MVIVQFTSALKRFFPEIDQTEVNATSLPVIIDKLNAKYPGIRDYILDERGGLRKHVNIFVNGKLIEDREQLSDIVPEGGEVYFFQALSGG